MPAMRPEARDDELLLGDDGVFAGGYLQGGEPLPGDEEDEDGGGGRYVDGDGDGDEHESTVIVVVASSPPKIPS